MPLTAAAAMKKELMLVALRFALLIAPIGVMYLVG
jgi:hypothetical protein